MFDKLKKQENKKLTQVGDKLLDEMLHYGPDTPEFDSALVKMEKVDKTRKSSSGFASGVSPDTVLLAGANLIGILIIVGYESRGVVTSFATKLLPTLKR
jgi:hypothetical protein